MLSKELQRSYDATLKITQGTMPVIILAATEEAAKEARAYIKGKHHAKMVTVQVERYKSL